MAEHSKIDSYIKSFLLIHPIQKKNEELKYQNGMFLKTCKAAQSLPVLRYLLKILHPEGMKKTIWPLYDNKMEGEFRKICLNVINDVICKKHPNVSKIGMSVLLQPFGPKFITCLLQLCDAVGKIFLSKDPDLKEYLKAPSPGDKKLDVEQYKINMEESVKFAEEADVTCLNIENETKTIQSDIKIEHNNYEAFLDNNNLDKELLDESIADEYVNTANIIETQLTASQSVVKTLLSRILECKVVPSSASESTADNEDNTKLVFSLEELFNKYLEQFKTKEVCFKLCVGGLLYAKKCQRTLNQCKIDVEVLEKLRTESIETLKKMRNWQPDEFPELIFGLGFSEDTSKEEEGKNVEFRKHWDNKFEEWKEEFHRGEDRLDATYNRMLLEDLIGTIEITKQDVQESKVSKQNGLAGVAERNETGGLSNSLPEAEQSREFLNRLKTKLKISNKPDTLLDTAEKSTRSAIEKYDKEEFIAKNLFEMPSVLKKSRVQTTISNISPTSSTSPIASSSRIDNLSSFQSTPKSSNQHIGNGGGSFGGGGANESLFKMLLQNKMSQHNNTSPISSKLHNNTSPISKYSNSSPVNKLLHNISIASNLSQSTEERASDILYSDDDLSITNNNVLGTSVLNVTSILCEEDLNEISNVLEESNTLDESILNENNTVIPSKNIIKNEINEEENNDKISTELENIDETNKDIQCKNVDGMNTTNNFHCDIPNDIVNVTVNFNPTRCTPVSKRKSFVRLQERLRKIKEANEKLPFN